MKRILFLLIALTLCSCSGSKKTDAPLPQVVVIFDHAPQHESYTFSDGAYGRISSEGVNYLDTMLRVQTFVPSADRADTIVIPTFDGLAEMYYTYWAMERVEYIFKAGDTIRFKYLHRDYPYAQCVNNPSHNKLYNKTDVAKSWRMANGFSAEAILTSFATEMVARNPSLWGKIFPGFIPPVDSLIRSYKQSRVAIQQQLDSLVQADKTYYERALYLQSLTDRKADKTIELFLNSTKGDKEPTVVSITMEEDPIGSFQKQLDDKRLNSLSYQSQELNDLLNLIATHYTPKVAYTTYNEQSGGTFFDHRVTFDTIASSQRIPSASKNTMLRKLFDNFQFLFASVDQEILYRQKYDSITADTSMRPLIKELEASLRLTDDLYLKDTHNQMVELKQIISQHKGKVIYVNYWSATCPPCIRVMPDAANLRKQFKGKDVVFVYLSCDKEENLWKNAIRKNNIQGANFMMVNSRVAPIIDQLKIYEYPRYMIYNKRGKLVEDRASGPSYPEASRQLLKYLNN